MIVSWGYPESSESGRPIRGIEDAERVAQVFHAGPARRDGALVTAGGRVLTGAKGIEDLRLTIEDWIADWSHSEIQNLQSSLNDYRPKGGPGAKVAAAVVRQSFMKRARAFFSPMLGCSQAPFQPTC